MESWSLSARVGMLLALACVQLSCGELLCPECDDLAAPEQGNRSFQAVGAFPNLPTATFDKFLIVRDKVATEARLTGIALPLLWTDSLYSSNDSCDPSVGKCTDPDCEIGHCPPCMDPEACYWSPSDNSDCRTQGFDQLECAIASYTSVWLRQGGLQPGSTVLFSIYGHSAEAGWRFGPSFQQASQDTPASLHSGVTWDHFRKLYDRLQELLTRHVTEAGMSLIIGLEDAPSGCADHGADEDYAEFFKLAREYIREKHQGPGPAPLVISPTPFLSELCDGVWDLDQESFSAREPALRRLNEHADAVAFRYHPMDSARGWIALNPDRAAEDMTRMVAFGDRLAPLEAGTERPIIITTVGYSSDSELHSSPSSPRYSVSAVGELAQAQLVKKLFEFAREHRRMRPQLSFNLFWGPLLDLGDAESEVCMLGASAIGKSDLATRRAYCLSGLLHPLSAGTLDKPAWVALRDGLAQSAGE